MPDTTREIAIDMTHRAMSACKVVMQLAIPVLLAFIAYLQLAEENRAIQRWESLAFSRRVAEIVSVDLSSRDLATKTDIASIEKEVALVHQRLTNLAQQMEPITNYLVRRGIIE